jgi:hypothetical protein
MEQSSFMYRYYFPRIQNIIDKINEGKANPFRDNSTWLDIQEDLIRVITNIERNIQKNKTERKELKSQLGNPSKRLEKQESARYKKRIDLIKTKNDSYQKLLIIFRTLGDSIAHTFINRFDIKPQSFKEKTGFISNKKGNRLERKCLRSTFQLGGIAILNDLTNSLRYFDITVIKSNDEWIPFEIKSGKRKTKRDLRQEESYERLTSYLFEDVPQEILQKGLKSTRVSFKNNVVDYISEINRLIANAKEVGLVVEQVEKGLVYVINYDNPFNSQELNSKLNRQNLVSPIPFSLNQTHINDFGYYPLPLIFEKSEYYIDLIKNKLEIFVFFDFNVWKKKLNRKRFKLELSEDENYIFWISGFLKGEPFKLGIGTYLMNRVFFEFLSPDFLFDEIMSFDKKLN